MLKNRALRKHLRNVAFGGLRSTGVFTIAANSKRRRESLLILCYHGFSMLDEHKWRPDLYMTEDKFLERLRLLRKVNASVLPLGEALQRLAMGTLPPRSVALTCDDGFYDFVVKAAPALAEFGYPMTVYLTSYYSNHRFPITNLAMDYVLWKSGQSELAMPKYGIYQPLELRNPSSRWKLVNQLLRWMEAKDYSAPDRDEVARELAQSVGVDYDEILTRRTLQILDPDLVNKLSRSGVDFQLHTHRHRTPLDESLFVREIEDNRSCIQEWTGKTPVHFCYPSGFYAPEFMSWLSQCGVTSATTCDRGLALRGSDRFLLPRVLDDSNISTLRFESIIYGLLV